MTNRIEFPTLFLAVQMKPFSPHIWGNLKCLWINNFQSLRFVCIKIVFVKKNAKCLRRSVVHSTIFSIDKKMSVNWLTQNPISIGANPLHRRKNEEGLCFVNNLYFTVTIGVLFIFRIIFESNACPSITNWVRIFLDQHGSIATLFIIEMLQMEFQKSNALPSQFENII